MEITSHFDKKKPKYFILRNCKVHKWSSSPFNLLSFFLFFYPLDSTFSKIFFVLKKSCTQHIITNKCNYYTEYYFFSAEFEESYHNLVFPNHVFLFLKSKNVFIIPMKDPCWEVKNDQIVFHWNSNKWAPKS